MSSAKQTQYIYKLKNKGYFIDFVLYYFVWTFLSYWMYIVVSECVFVVFVFDWYVSVSVFLVFFSFSFFSPYFLKRERV